MPSNNVKRIVYSILKEILEGEGIPTAKDYDISENEFFEIISLMKNEEYINPKKVSLCLDGSGCIIKSIDTLIMKGIDFLESNSNWSKFYKGLKEFRNFIPI